MATYTDKLNLKKPNQMDFYNVDDFNENFDKIEEYTENFQLKTFTELKQIGLTIGSETIESIANALETNSVLFISVGASNNQAIYPGTSSGAKYGVLRVTKRLDERILFEFFSIDTTTNYTRYWLGLYTNTWIGWVESLSEKGGTINGNLRIRGDWFGLNLQNTDGTKKAIVELAPNGGMHFYSHTNESNNNRLSLNDESTALTDALMFYNTVKGIQKGYKIYGEHNLPSPAKIQIGEYVGTGTNKREIPMSFGFTPKVVFISGYGCSGYSGFAVLIYGQEYYWARYNYAGNHSELDLEGYYDTDGTLYGAVWEDGLLTLRGRVHTDSEYAKVMNTAGNVYKVVVIG